MIGKLHAHGFTLVELLVATSLFTMVSGGIYGTYRTGVRCWAHRGAAAGPTAGPLLGPPRGRFWA